MNRAALLLAILAILAGIATGAYIIVTQHLHTPYTTTTTTQGHAYRHGYGHGQGAVHAQCTTKTVVMILLPGFRWVEFHVTYNMLKNKGANIVLACPNSETLGVKATSGGVKLVTVKCNTTLSTNLSGNALVIIGGPGEYCILLTYLYNLKLLNKSSTLEKYVTMCKNMLKSLGVSTTDAINYVNTVVKLVQKFYSEHKLIAAICVAPTFLAIAKILNNTHITMWNAPYLTQYVKQHGGILELSKSVVVSDNIITANGPSAAHEFANKIVEALCK